MRHWLSQCFTGLGYVSLILAWLWLAIIGLPPLVESGMIDGLLPSAERPANDQTGTGLPDALSPLATALAGLFTVFILIITAITLWRMPRDIVRGGNKVINRSTDVVVPIVTHHKHVPKKRRVTLTRRVQFALQLAFGLLPCLIVLILPAPDELPRLVIQTVSAFIAGSIVVLFSGAFLLAGTTSQTRSRVSRGSR